MSKTVLCLLFPGFEEIEAITPVDLLRRAGAGVTLASLHGEKWVTGRCNIAVQADADLAGLDGGSFDLLMIPGGPGIKGLRADGRAAALAAKYALAGKPIGAICAAPLVLWDAGLLTDKKFTAHSSTHGELPQALALEPVVMDGGIITARGAGTAMDFGFALVARLFGEPAAREIAKAIMV